jgi:predicted unusual protein kinase regulating ubiquinone biosynthesis (AarF/ABC1/UbiB family)
LATLQIKCHRLKAQAKQLLRERSVRNGFPSTGNWFNKGPIAAASIGQVYRGFIDDKVAVRCSDRTFLPRLLDHIVREFAPIYQKITGGRRTCNRWPTGRGFHRRVGLSKEAAATIRFNQEMKSAI